MQIELYIDGEQKTFTAPFVPMSAKRRFMEIQAEAEKRKENPTAEDYLKEDDAIYSILSDIVFKGQFTLEQLYEGASKEYLELKLAEVLYGEQVKKKDDK